MQLSAIILALAAAATAQETIKACDGKAQKCIDDAIASSDVCEAGDNACGCENMDAIQQEATPCVIEACGGADEARMYTLILYLLSFRQMLTHDIVKVVEEVKEVCKSIA